MIMKKVLFPLLLALALYSTSFAQSGPVSISTDNAKIDSLKQVISSISENIGKLNKQLSEQQKSILNIQKAIADVNGSYAALSDTVAANASSVRAENAGLLAKVDEANKAINDNQEDTAKSIKNKTTLGAIVAAFLLLVALSIFFFFKKKFNIGNSVIDQIKESQGKLQEESVRLDGKLLEVIEKQLSVSKVEQKPEQNASDNTGEVDHSLALKVADEIVRIEKNLKTMDESVKGYKPLVKAVQRIKDNFLANGYEMVDMLGKDYSTGLKASVTFVDDESMEKGKSVITRVIKPQVNYKGTMIQIAQIEVTHNE